MAATTGSISRSTQLKIREEPCDHGGRSAPHGLKYSGDPGRHTLGLPTPEFDCASYPASLDPGGNYSALIPVSAYIQLAPRQWLHPPSLERGFLLHYPDPLILTTSASSLGWGAVLGDLTAQGL
ncbi:hypothetical protein NDU88_001537 [Pleurodeles waltl]|uniref:Uncharacterized protein n=1 Tax=Pleurodeles waltl TaxID=8319 RepID=A0AAV7MLA3_PLEWA|nr:hypothetical protein NDU88_001537 [Pleurodeles waltl]